MSNTAPSLSVIIASTAPLRQVPACLSAIAQQGLDREVEIIFVYSAEDQLRERLAVDAAILLIRIPQTASLPQLLGAALTRARGKIVAVTDATCIIDERWISAILEAHEQPYPVIGGAVEPAGLATLVDWAAYFCEYGQFMLPLEEGIVHEVPGNNLSMKRWVLTQAREFLEGEFWKTYWCQHIQAEGVSLYAAPAIVVFYQKSFRLWPFLVRRFWHGRCFAGMRIAQLSRLTRFFYGVGAPALPILFCSRILSAVLSKRRYFGQFFLCFPIIILATISWALGEFSGYLSGPGTSCRHVR